MFTNADLLLPGRPVDDSSPVVLAVAENWFSVNGGLSTLNRELCLHLKRAGASVYCVVPSFTVTERDHARGDPRDLP